MDVQYQNIQIRNALPSDAEQLCAWWNDGAVMAHAGFPNGLGITLDPNLKNTRAQHVYEQLGCRKVGEEIDSWRDQLGQLQSAVLYELTPENFISYIPNEV